MAEFFQANGATTSRGELVDVTLLATRVRLTSRSKAYYGLTGSDGHPAFNVAPSTVSF